MQGTLETLVVEEAVPALEPMLFVSFISPSTRYSTKIIAVAYCASVELSCKSSQIFLIDATANTDFLACWWSFPRAVC